MKLGDALRERAGLEPAVVQTICDECGTPTEAGEFALKAQRMLKLRRPPALCHGCYEGRRERELQTIQAKTRADNACWRVFRQEWRAVADGDEKRDEKREEARQRLIATVYQKAEYDELSREWIRNEQAGLHRKSSRRKGKGDDAAGF